jgi:hypothetical protein
LSFLAHAGTVLYKTTRVLEVLVTGILSK